MERKLFQQTRLESRNLLAHHEGNPLPARGQFRGRSWDGTAKLWSVDSGEERRTLKGHVGAVYSVAFHGADPYVVPPALPFPADALSYQFDNNGYFFQ